MLDIYKMKDVAKALDDAVEALTLPPGVHLLSEESRIILEKAALRGSKLAARHLKPQSP